MWLQVVAAVGPLVISVATSAVAYAAFRRAARAEDAKTSAEAIGVGLDYVKLGIAEQRQAMEQATSHLQDVIREQQGDIGRLQGELKACREERQAMAAEIADLKARLP